MPDESSGIQRREGIEKSESEEPLQPMRLLFWCVKSRGKKSGRQKLSKVYGSPCRGYRDLHSKWHDKLRDNPSSEMHLVKFTDHTEFQSWIVNFRVEHKFSRKSFLIEELHHDSRNLENILRDFAEEKELRKVGVKNHCKHYFYLAFREKQRKKVLTTCCGCASMYGCSATMLRVRSVLLLRYQAVWSPSLFTACVCDLCRVRVLVRLSHPRPPDRNQHGCTVGVLPGPTRVLPMPRQCGIGRRAPTRAVLSCAALWCLVVRRPRRCVDCLVLTFCYATPIVLSL